MRTTKTKSTLIFFLAASIFAFNTRGLADDPDANAKVPTGTWRMVAVVVDGKDSPVGSSTFMTVTSEGWTVTIGGKPFAKGTTKHDPKSPIQSEVTYTEGDLAGKTLKQISKIEGDVMIACAGAGRPIEFMSKVGSGHTLSVWIRVN